MSQYLFGIGLKNGLVQSVKFQNIQAGDLPVVPGLNPGGYTNANIVVDQFGRITSAANGSGGGGSGTVTSVDVSGGATGLTTSGGPVTTSGVITIGGILNAASGGLGIDSSSFTIGQIPIAQGAGVYAADGRRGLYTGSGPPAPALGFPTDYYIDLSSGTIYLKS